MRILLFRTEDDTRIKIEQAVIPLPAEVCIVPPEDYGKHLSELAGEASGGEEASYAGTADICPAPGMITEPMLVFAGIPDLLLSPMLDKLKAAGVRIARKAVLTEYNRTWTPAQLYTAVSEEIESIRKQRQP